MKANRGSLVIMVIMVAMVVTSHCHQDRKDRQNSHLNLIFQLSCEGQLSQCLRCFTLEIYGNSAAFELKAEKDWVIWFKTSVIQVSNIKRFFISHHHVLAVFFSCFYCVESMLYIYGLICLDYLPARCSQSLNWGSRPFQPWDLPPRHDKLGPQCPGKAS